MALREYLDFFGYQGAEGIKRLQDELGVSVLTDRIPMLPRCGLQDHTYSVGGYWGIRRLKWCVRTFPSNRIPKSRQIEILEQSFKNWEAVADIKYELTNSPSQANILIDSSSSRADGLGTVGNTLAYAGVPGKNFKGQLPLVFDRAEIWTEGNEAGTGLEETATHEIGHINGLLHSQDRNALMFAFYVHGRKKPQEDDIRGIQKLYGTPVPGTPVPGTPVPGTPVTYVITTTGQISITRNGKPVVL